MTEISTYGEFGLIKHLTKDLKTIQPSTEKSIGDDCAVMDFNKGKSTKESRVLMTTDMLLEGVHFNLEYVPLKHLGYKAAVVNFSDIYAMNGTPTQITVGLGISKRFSVEEIEELYSGIRLACERYGVDLVGGDTCASMTGLTISITCLGVADEKDIVYRNGAKLNDLICVSGNLGTAYMGLQLLERELMVQRSTNYGNNPSTGETEGVSAFEGKEYLGRSLVGVDAYMFAVECGLLHLRGQTADRLSGGSFGGRDEPQYRHLRSQRRRGLRAAFHLFAR